MELRSFIPEARIAFFFRDPLLRAFSSYKYFCLQDRKYGYCDTQHFVRRIEQSVIFIRYTVCDGKLGVNADSSVHPRCKEFRDIPKVPHASKIKKWRVVRRDVADVWPANDPELMLDWWSFNSRSNMFEHVHRGGVMEGIYWPRLIEWLNEWPEEQVMNIVSDGFDENPEQTVRKLLTFFGVSETDYPVVTDDKKHYNIADEEKRASNKVKLDPEAKRMLEAIFTPHLEKHAQVLEAIIEKRSLPVLPSHQDQKATYMWLPDQKEKMEDMMLVM
jgi:hypothetical protein